MNWLVGSPLQKPNRKSDKSLPRKGRGSIALLPHCRKASGGPASFQRKLSEGLFSRGLAPCYDLGGGSVDALLLINATRHLSQLGRAKYLGLPIIQRLGTPFASSVPSRGELAKRMRIWLGLRNVALIRAYVADKVVYQSRFAQACWDRNHGQLEKPSTVIYNGVDLTQFSPEGPKYVSDAEVCIISVEGTQPAPDDHPALLLGRSLIEQGVGVELLLFGRPLPGTEDCWGPYSFVRPMGLVPNTDLPFFYRGSTLFVSADIIAACPNSVIEALACGTPVLGYDFSVLPEMVDCGAGRCVPPMGDLWKGERPGNVVGLCQAAMEIVEDNVLFRMNARKLAEDRYNLDCMVDEYLTFLLGASAMDGAPVTGYG